MASRYDELFDLVQKQFESKCPETLTYHNFSHVKGVVKACEDQIEFNGLNSKDAEILLSAAVLHDVGVLDSYDNHEEKGVQFAEKVLPKLGYHDNEIQGISSLIRATKLPQNPKTLLEKILCDADLDYLGTENFKKIGDLLYLELKNLGNEMSPLEWNQKQIEFLQSHSYNTEYAQRYREETKQRHLKHLVDQK